MPALSPTAFQCEIVWMGMVPKGAGGLRSTSVASLTLGFDGAQGESHSGENRASCVRVKEQYPVGTQIRNVRQLSILSQEELDSIATEMGLAQIDPQWLGASIVVRGLPDFSNLPPSSRLIGPTGASVCVDMQNRPCILPGREIEMDQPGFGALFKSAAKGRRGVTAWVECPGDMSVGDRLNLHIPDQPVWQCLDQARA